MCIANVPERSAQKRSPYFHGHGRGVAVAPETDDATGADRDPEKGPAGAAAAATPLQAEPRRIVAFDPFPLEVARAIDGQEGNSIGTAAEKIEAFRAAGISVSETPADMGNTLARRLGLKVK